MESLVDADTMGIIKQILSNLICNDNELRSRCVPRRLQALSVCSYNFSAERAVDEKLAEAPEVYLLALVQLSRTEPDEVVSLDLDIYTP